MRKLCAGLQALRGQQLNLINCSMQGNEGQLSPAGHSPTHGGCGCCCESGPAGQGGQQEPR